MVLTVALITVNGVILYGARDLYLMLNPDNSNYIFFLGAINKGLIKGPRVYTAGKSIATTGGHADPTNGYRKDLMGDPGPREGVINSPEEARQAVRQRYKDGSDLIKITATGGVNLSTSSIFRAKRRAK